MSKRWLVLALLTVSFAASAEVYRWVDGQGNVHYADRPAGDNAELVSTIVTHRSNPTVVAQRTQTEQTQRQQAADQRQEQQDQDAAASAVRKDVKETRAEQCKKAQEQYKTAIESQKLYRVGKNGEREYLTSAEIDEARINSKRAVDLACGSTK
jgi:hypothetical protein